MTDEVICPYCHKEVEIEIEDPEDGLTVQEECPECGKILNVTPSIEITFDVEECKCQSENHFFVLTHCYPKCFTKWICKYCGYAKPLTGAQRKRLGIPKDYEEERRQDALNIKKEEE